MLLLRRGKQTDIEYRSGSSARPDENLLAKIFNTVDIGGQVSTLIFAEGWKAVLDTAMTASETWMAIANSAVRYADFSNR